MSKKIVEAMREFQEDVEQFCIEKGFERDLDIRLEFLEKEFIEVKNELAKLMDPTISGAEKERIKIDLGMEIYDVIWNLADLANLADSDLSESFERKISINKDRIWTTRT